MLLASEKTPKKESVTSWLYVFFLNSVSKSVISIQYFITILYKTKNYVLNLGRKKIKWAMDINTTYWFFKKLLNDKLCLLYNGSFSDKMTYKFIELSEYNLNNNADLSRMKSRVSFLMAECFQNIVRHGESKEEEKSKEKLPGFFSTKNTNNTYFIASGNLIDKNNIEQLENKLKHVNSLNKDELKDLYRNVMGNEGFSEKGGAGLGLIEMARKSGHSIEYAFQDYNEDLSIFYNQIRLEKEDEDINFPIEEVIDFHNTMNEQGILLLQKGDFSQETILPVLNIIEQNLKSVKSSKINKSVYLVLVELLQNISTNSQLIDNRHEGIFIIQQTDLYFSIAAGNYVAPHQVADFERRLKMVQSASEDELEELYEMELLEDSEDNSTRIGLGLIDIARKSSEKLNYNFQEINSERVFFTIQVTI